MDKRVLILGVGNTLLGDEGFGVHALRELESNWTWPENVRLIDGGTLGLMLMAELLECDQVYILDIARGGQAAGTFYRIEEFSSDLGLHQSMHQTSIEDVLMSCELAGHRPQAVAFAMEPFDMESLSPELTPAAKVKLPVFCAKVVEELARDGIMPARRQAVS